MIQSFKVVSTLAAYRAVAPLTGTANTVQYPNVATAIPFGITKDTVKDTTNSIPVAGPGEIELLYFNDTVTSGNLVGVDTSGRGVPYTVAPDTTTSLTLSAAYLGTLLGPTIGLTGTLAHVYIHPGIAKGTR